MYLTLKSYIIGVDYMKIFHILLTGLSATIVALSINRLTPITQQYLQPFDYLRLMDFLAMIPIPLASVLLYYFLKENIMKNGKAARTTHLAVFNLLLITGIYLFAAGSGTHEVTNYMNIRFCDSGESATPICRIIAYNDDEFSHYVYYAGFILLNVALMGFEYFHPRSNTISRRDVFGISANSLIIGLGIFANLAFEEIGIDLYIFGAVMLLALWLLFKGKHKPAHLPVTMYFAISYTLGVVGTLIYGTLI